MKRKFHHSNLLKPTPKKWKQIGNSLLSASVFIAGFSLYNGHQWIAISSFITGLIGTILTRFFTNE